MTRKMSTSLAIDPVRTDDKLISKSNALDRSHLAINEAKLAMIRNLLKLKLKNIDHPTVKNNNNNNSLFVSSCIYIYLIH